MQAAANPVFDLSNYAVNFYSFPPLAVGFLVFLLGFSILFLERGSRVSILFFLLTTAAFIWLSAYGVAYAARTPEIAIWWIKLGHTGISLIPMFILLFTLSMIGALQYLAYSLPVLFFISFSFCILSLKTTYWVNGVYSYFWGYYARYGFGSVAFLVFFFAVITLSLYLLRKGSQEASGKARLRIQELMVAFLVGSLGSIDFLPTYGIMVYPFGYLFVLVFIVLIVRAIRVYRLVEWSPAFAANEILETIPSAVLVVDMEGHIRVVNRGACDLLGYSQTELNKMEISRITRFLFDIQSEPGQKHPMHWRKKDGGNANVNVTISFLKGRDGSLEGIIYVAVDVTERKKMEEALEQSEERFRLMINSVQDYAIYMLDTAGNVVTWNRGAQRIKGYFAEEIIGKHFSCFFLPEDIKNGVPESALKETKEKGHFQIIGWRKRKNGSRFWADAVMTALRDSQGNLTGFANVTRDRSEKKEAEDALLRLAQLVESSDDAILGLALDGRILSWNAGAEKIYGYKRTEMEGKSLFEIISPEYVPEVKNLFSKMARGERFEHYPIIILAKGESPVDVSVTFSPIQDSMGRVVGFSSVSRNITKSRQIELALRASEKRLRDILATAHDGFIEFSDQGVVLDWNRQAEILFGWTSQEALGKNFVGTVIAEQHRKTILDGLSRYLETGDQRMLNRRLEVTACRRGGEEFPVEITVWPVRAGSQITFNAFVHDITDRKQREESEALQRKAQLVTTLSHEIRTPLTAIKMGLDILMGEEAGKLNPQQSEWLDMAWRNTQRLAQLIDRVLQFQRLESDRVEYDFQPHDLNSLIQDLGKTFQLLASRKPIELKLEFAENLPLVYLDKEMIIEVLMNFVGNAVKFTEKGSICVRTRYLEAEKAAEVTVADTGIGLRPEERGKLFHYYRQAKDKPKNVEGTGLGLAICRKIIEQHRGEIGVFSEFGKGSTFYFKLPLRPASVPAGKKPVSEPGS